MWQDTDPDPLRKLYAAPGQLRANTRPFPRQTMDAFQTYLGTSGVRTRLVGRYPGKDPLCTRIAVGRAYLLQGFGLEVLAAAVWVLMFSLTILFSATTPPAPRSYRRRNG